MGTASVIDGDTLEIHGQRIRLYGIDAPESDQLCKENGQRYRCGQKAAIALSDFIGWRTVSCRQRDTDRYGRIVALCSVSDQDLGTWLVSNGHALAYRKYSLDYVGAERAAAAARIGIWAGEFDAPWEWRWR
jgi:endonuclease YncB( thermonuclease family)